MKHRIRQQLYPAIGDHVMVKVLTTTDDFCAHVSLLQYAEMEGMIIVTEASYRSNKRSELKLEHEEVAQVINIDQSKGYVDLSKRRVRPADAAAARRIYEEEKRTDCLARDVAVRMSKTIESVYDDLIWQSDFKYDPITLVNRVPAEILAKHFKKEKRSVVFTLCIWWAGAEGVDYIKSRLTELKQLEERCKIIYLGGKYRFVLEGEKEKEGKIVLKLEEWGLHPTKDGVTIMEGEEEE